MENTLKLREIISEQIPKSESIMFDFFITFARFECALKASKYLKTNRGYVEADWKKFSESISESFNSNFSGDIKHAVDYILKNPPAKQVIKDDVLDWEEKQSTAETDVEKLVFYIKNVRNNMFHGGKFNSIRTEEDRNYKLIVYSIQILNYWLNLDKEVKNNFLSDINPQ